MPRNQIYMEKINKSFFMKVLKNKKSSIRKLGSIESVECTEKTIRRSLNQGRINPVYLEQIAEYLDVDPRYLSGEIFKGSANFSKVLPPENFPYFKKIQDEQNKKPIKELLEQLFSLFDINYAQFEVLDFERQYEIQHDLFEAIIPIISKHFSEDGWGRKGIPLISRIIFELESYRDDYYENIYADTTLRKKYQDNPPDGISRKDILSMSPEELLELDNYLDSKNTKPLGEEDPFIKKYGI